MFQKLHLTCFRLLVVGLLVLSAVHAKSQTTIEQEPAPQASPIEIVVRPLPALQNSLHYQQLDERLELEKTGEVITLVVGEFTNHLAIPVWTRLGDIVCLTGTTRYLPVTYLQRETVTGMPTYQLPDWDTTIQLIPGQKITLHLGFIVKPGENANVENSVKVYALFRHTEIQTVHHSISISRRGDTPTAEQPPDSSNSPESDAPSDYPTPPPPPPSPTFHLSPQLNSIVVRELLFPTTTINPDGAPGLKSILGNLGLETRYPYWFGVAQAIEEGFDYFTGIQLLDEVADYYERHGQLIRTTMWLEKQKVLLAVTAEQSYIATSVHGIVAVPVEAAEVILFVASKIVGTRAEQTLLDQAAVAPIPGTYEEFRKPNPGEVIGFQIECLGLRMKAEKSGHDYHIELFRKDQPDQPLRPPLNYRRKLF